MLCSCWLVNLKATPPTGGAEKKHEREMMPGQIAVQTDAAEFEPLTSFDSVFKTYERLVLQL